MKVRAQLSRFREADTVVFLGDPVVITVVPTTAVTLVGERIDLLAAVVTLRHGRE